MIRIKSSFLYKNKWLIGTVVFGIMLCVLIVFALYSKKFTPVMYLSKMFYSQKDGFQWSSFTALAAICALGFNWSANQKEIKANLISKSRIEWISDVREHTSNLIDYYHNFKIMDYKDYVKNNKKNVKQVIFDLILKKQEENLKKR